MSTIQYTRVGSGEPVVLIHGIGHRRQAWGDVIDLLAADHEVIAIDVPGFGESPAPKRPFSLSMGSIADQIEALFAELGLVKPHVAGNSMGGYLALDLARRDSVASATALSPAGFYNWLSLQLTAAELFGLKLSSEAPKALTRRVLEVGALRKLFFFPLYAHPERVTYQHAYDDTMNLRDSKGFWPCVVHLTFLRWKGTTLVPTTIGWGSKDRLLMPSQGRRAARMLPEVTFVELDDCGHVPMFDNPKVVTEVIRQQVAAASASRLESVAT